jgi:hypothetical protein
MRFTLLAAAFALAAASGSASADQTVQSKTVKQFNTLNGVKAIQMSATELNAVKGMDHHFTVTNPATGDVTTHNTDQHKDETGVGGKGDNFFSFVGADGVTRLVAPSYHGLSQACGNGVIDGPGFLC